MKPYVYCIVPVLLLLVAGACGKASDSLAAIKVEVSDYRGEPVTDAKVYLTLVDASGKAVATAEAFTDKLGLAEFKDLPLGEFTAHVRGSAQNTAFFKVNLKNFTGPNRGKVAGSCVL